VSDAPEHRGPISDEEAALFRFLRYGQLPERVLPSERVELVDAESGQAVSDPAADPTGVWNLRYA
jgi:hypothetical protein